MAVQAIKFKGTAVSSVHGSFSTGDVFRTDAETAKHFVDLGVAEFLDAPEKKVQESTKADDKQKGKK